MTSATTSAALAPPPRRWFRLRFSLRTLLILTTLCGVGTAYGVKVWKRYLAIRAIEKKGSIAFGRSSYATTGRNKDPFLLVSFGQVDECIVRPDCDIDFENLAAIGRMKWTPVFGPGGGVS